MKISTDADYRASIRRPTARRIGALALVQQVFEEGYGLQLADHDAGLAPSDLGDRSARFQQALARSSSNRLGFAETPQFRIQGARIMPRCDRGFAKSGFGVIK